MKIEAHDMELVSTHPGGTEEWCCPRCGYRLLVGPPPYDQQFIMEKGDPDAVHRGYDAYSRRHPGLSAVWVQALQALDLSVLPDIPEQS